MGLCAFFSPQLSGCCFCAVLRLCGFVFCFVDGIVVNLRGFVFLFFSCWLFGCVVSGVWRGEQLINYV